MTMILTDRTELSEGAVVSAIHAVRRSFTDWRVRRAKRIALRGLLELDAHRLDDLGLSVEAVRDALVHTNPR